MVSSPVSSLNFTQFRTRIPTTSLVLPCSELCDKRLLQPIALNSALNVLYMKQTSHKIGMAGPCTKSAPLMHIEGLIHKGHDWSNAMAVMCGSGDLLSLLPHDLSRDCSLCRLLDVVDISNKPSKESGLSYESADEGLQVARNTAYLPSPCYCVMFLKPQQFIMAVRHFHATFVVPQV